MPPLAAVQDTLALSVRVRVRVLAVSRRAEHAAENQIGACQMSDVASPS